MANDILLSSVTQDDFDTAEATLISLLRAAYPSLDLRRGTVIRDVLIRPAATVYALDTKRIDDLKAKLSLLTLQDDPTASPEDVDAILANFDVARGVGSVATGSIIVRVDGARVYAISAGFRFTTLEGLGFTTQQNYTVKSVPGAGELQLYTGTAAGSFYFVLPVVAEAVGVQYNIPQGTTMEPVAMLFGFVAAESYVNFSSGTDEETINQVIARLPAAVSYKALESRTAIGAKLQTQFQNVGGLLQALSVQGYGDAAQLRDKHNPMGFAVGSRVDLYPRTFFSPAIATLTKTGTLIAPNTYQFQIERADAPGYYAIRSISETNAAISAQASGLPVAGSYAFVEVREADGLSSTFHDIDPANGMIETANSCYQKATINVTGVPQSSGNTHDFKVELYVAPNLLDVQTFVDSSAVRNVEADYIARCPFICLVNLNVTVFYNTSVTIDVEKMRQDVTDYINTRSFVPRLTRSELTCIMFADGATRIDLSASGMALQGIIRDAAGEIHTLQGDSLELGQIDDASRMLTSDTIVFAAELGSIHIEAIGE